MARHWIKMHDFWTVKSSAVVDPTKQKDSEGGKSLLVKVAATHAGIINGNMRFYRPDRMQDGTSTWTPPQGQFARPILIGHDEHGAVVGRVMGAKYHDLSFKYKPTFSQLRDSVFYGADSAKKKTDLFKTIDWIVENLMVLEDYQGLGYIELSLKVSNPDAVQKILREEFLTVSVGFKTDSAICSICHQDWAVDDRCDHRLGEVVDGKQMFLISGAMDFEEVSFVNFPADPFAGVVSKEKLADGLARMKPFFLGLPVRQQVAMSKTAGLALTDSLYDADISIVEDKMAEQITKTEETVVTPAATAAEDELQAALVEETAVAPAADATPAAEVKDAAPVAPAAEPVKDGKTGEKLLKVLSSLDEAYKATDDDEAKGLLRAATSQLVETWYADSYLSYIKSRLEEKDMVLLTKAEAEAKDAAVTAAETNAANARKQIDTLLANYKRSLASQIVMAKVTAKSEGFKDLSADQIKAKVDELSKRHVQSLRDSVADILSELKFTDAAASTPAPAPAPSAPEATPAEDTTQVTDNTKVAEPAAPVVKDEAAEAEKAAKLRQARLNAMTPRERALFLADERTAARKAKKTN